MPKFGSQARKRWRYGPYHRGGQRRQNFKKQQRLPARQQFADQLGGYALNKGDTVKTNLKIFTDPRSIALGNAGTGAYDLARQIFVRLADYGVSNDDYRLITAAWQRYRIVGATIFVGQPYYWNSTGGGSRTYYDGFVYLAVLKKAVNGTINTATMRGLENCEFKLMTNSNDLLRKRMKYPAVPVETAIAGSTAPEAFKNMWLQTTDDGATVPHYSFLIGAKADQTPTTGGTTVISIDYQVQLELQLDRPNYQNNNISSVRINADKPSQSDLDRIEELYEKHFGKPQPSCTLEIESEDEPEVPMCVKLLKPAPLRPRARAQSE